MAKKTIKTDAEKEADAKRGGLNSSRQNSPNKRTEEFKLLCKAHNYDPAVKLIEHRNMRMSEFDRLYKQAKALEAKVKQNPKTKSEIASNEANLSLSAQFYDIAFKCRSAAERIDKEMMPYRYSKLSSIAVTDPNGGDFISAFAAAVARAK